LDAPKWGHGESKFEAGGNGVEQGGILRLVVNCKDSTFAIRLILKRAVAVDHLECKPMTGDAMTDLRYPIGKFSYDGHLTEDQKRTFLDDIAQTPAKLRASVKALSGVQLDTPYRPGGWTVRQVVHHVPDSHLNAYVRFKLALTEDEPTIKPYAEDRWAQLADTKATPVEVSLTLLESLHDRWVRLLRSLTPEEWKRTFRHPELGAMTLEKTLALYAWHGRHHVSHITGLRERSGW
jgi:uncharacterized damage-inducible protein DinB